MKDTIYISNTSQGKISLNCSFYDGATLVPKYYDIPPARECVGIPIDRDDWERIKNTHIVKAWVDTGILLPEKKKVSIDQETGRSSTPEPTGELADVSLSELAKGRKARTVVGSRKADTELKG